MSTVFPQSDRVIYTQNPLNQVVCQFRFPIILRIESQPPSEFQELVRARFPNYSASTSQTLPANIPPEIRKLLLSNPSSSAIDHQFSTADGSWVLTLTKDSLSLTANKYRRWEEFRQVFDGPLQALKDIYTPSVFNRIGLRYINTIDFNSIASEAPLTDLFQPHVLGPLQDLDLAKKCDGTYATSAIRLDEQSSVRLSTGLGEQEDIATKQKHQVFIIDADFHSVTETEISHANKTIDRFNSESGRLFRWCITDKLHQLMEPVKP